MQFKKIVVQDLSPDGTDNNFWIAEERFDNLKEKLNKNKALCEEYKTVIDDLLPDEIVEESKTD